MARQATNETVGTAPQQAEYASALFGKFCGHIDALGEHVPLLEQVAGQKPQLLKKTHTIPNIVFAFLKSISYEI